METTRVEASQDASDEAAALGGVRLLLPLNDVLAPELSLVIPALNEERTVAEFVAWCHQGLAAANVLGEILIVDSSSDSTSELALAGGARVLRTPKRGLGRAYIDALPYVRGRWIVMGDADCTYDFRQLGEFVARFREGNEFVMGSRWMGSIEPGSMPALHRYLGTPITTAILNVLFGSHFSDIHCGMRGITRDALQRMRLSSQSWEYASEMVLKSVQMRLKTAQVPVVFLRDREGRLSHHKRAGWLSPFGAAWINLRAMFVYGVEFFTFRPGMLLALLGLLITLPLSLGPITVGRVHLSLYTMLVGVTLTVLGVQSFFLGCIGQALHDRTGAARRRWLRVFRYSRTVILSAVVFLIGMILASLLVVKFVHLGLTLQPSGLREAYLAVMGMLLMISAFITFTFTLLLHAVCLQLGAERAHDSD